jgi:spoIIIJ-associated protein
VEWVEVTGRTIEEARGHALDRLGVAEEDAEFEILEEPRTGLFGRLKGEARVRARVRPAQARHKMDRRDRRREKAAAEQRGDAPVTDGDRGGQPRRKKTPRGPRPNSAEAAATATSLPTHEHNAAPSRPSNRERAPRADRADTSARPSETTSSSPSRAEEPIMSAEQVGQEAVRFLDGLVQAFGLEGTAAAVTDGDEIDVRVSGEGLGLLVGPRGTTLQAVQDLVRVAAQRRLGDHDTRLRVDIGGYRERRSAALHAFALKQAEEVAASGVARVLEPMSSADRKVIHDSLSEIGTVTTRSEGDDPYRRVVIVPADG